MKKKINIKGMSCNHCIMHVKNALMEVEGVKNVEVYLEERYAVVEGDNLNDKKMKVEVEEAGYDVIGVEEL